MQKCVKNEKRYRLINFICLLAVYKKLIGTGRVLGTSILLYGSKTMFNSNLRKLPSQYFPNDYFPLMILTPNMLKYTPVSNKNT